MGKYIYSEEEEKLLKVAKMNEDLSLLLLNDPEMNATREKADDAIARAEALLKSKGLDKDLKIGTSAREEKLKITPRSYEETAAEADKLYDHVEIEDILSPQEIQSALDDLNRIEREFSKKTSIINKVDLSFLGIATALHVAKALITPRIAERFGYGEDFDPAERKAHNDKEIEKKHKEANDKFRDKYSERYAKGYWTQILYQSVPYDAIKGSAELDLNINGKNHRLKTLGHDPILGSEK